jgi:hypothetical protein
MAFLQAAGKTVAEREAHAEIENGIADLRFARDVAAGKQAAALELVRSRRAVLSAQQSLVKLLTSEAELARVGPPGATP